MANPIKAVKAVSKFTAGKAKSIRKREVAKNKMSPQMATPKAKLAKATSNKKISKAGVNADIAFKSRPKDFAKVAKKQGKAVNPKSNFPWYANDLPKVPAKKRGN
jgi:hypothetical protein